MEPPDEKLNARTSDGSSPRAVIVRALRALDALPNHERRFDPHARRPIIIVLLFVLVSPILATPLLFKIPRVLPQVVFLTFIVGLVGFGILWWVWPAIERRTDPNREQTHQEQTAHREWWESWMRDRNSRL